MNVRLRDLEPGDLPMVFEQQLDPDANRMAVANPRGRAEFDAHWAKVLADRNTVVKAIITDDRFAGHITCFRSGAENASEYWVGYWIDKQHWGKGICTRALVLLLEEVAIRPLHARVARANVASIKVLERCGFVITGYRLAPADDRFPECEEALLLLA